MDEQYGIEGQVCPHSGCVCMGPVSCAPGWPCFIDKSGDVIQLLEYDSSDRDSLLEMYTHISKECPSLGRPPGDRWNLEEWLDILLDTRSNYVAHHESTIVGHSTYSPGVVNVPELLTFVHPEYWDRGIGTELSRHCIRNANQDTDQLIINVASSNSRATHVGKKLGFNRKNGADYSTRMQLRVDSSVSDSDI